MSGLRTAEATYTTEVDSFWSSGQRRGHSLHEISYRACFKPQLPEFFIRRYSVEGDVVLDPFMGRGTTPLQAMLMGRVAFGSDVNPLSVMLTEPRLAPPRLSAVERRFREILSRGGDVDGISDADEDLLVFYHPHTLRHLLSLRAWFGEREAAGNLTAEDKWIRMVVINRLAGHSPGFLSVKTMPPNQAVSVASQRKINEKHGRVPEGKDVLGIVMKKSRSLLRDWNPQPLLQVVKTAEEMKETEAAETTAAAEVRRHRLGCARADNLDYVRDGEVQLIVTSPPFLNVVDYGADNWLRCWFAGIDMGAIDFNDKHRSVDTWEGFIRSVFIEFARVVKAGGYVAFEVGEVRNGSVKLENNVVKAAAGLPFEVEKVFINSQHFTKTANCWGIDNNAGGTLSNRIVLLRRR